LAQGPVDCFFNKVTFISSISFNDWEKVGVITVFCLFVMYCQPSNRSKRRSADKFAFVFCPLKDFFMNKIPLLGNTLDELTTIAKELGMPVEIDDDLGEIKVGDFSGKKEEEYHKVFPSALERFKKAPENGETLTDLTRRMHNAIFKLEKRFKDKKILIVSHGDPLWILEASLKGLTKEGIAEFSKENYIKTGELREIELRNLPFDENGFLDPHKPFIDAVEFDCECGGKMTRTPEVIDVWFDSGSMPFAQWHYPHENKERIESLIFNPPF